MGGRLEMPAAMPAHIAELRSDVPRREPTTEELAQAKEELRDELLAGKTRSGFDLNACLDCEFNSDGYTGTVNDLAQIVLNLHGDGNSAAGTWLAVQSLAEQIVERHIPEHAIAERAAQIANDAEVGSC